MKSTKWLLLICTVLLFSTLYCWLTINRLKDHNRELSDSIFEKDKVSKIWMDVAGRAHQKLEVKEMSSQAAEIKYKAKIDSLTKLYDIKPKQIIIAEEVVSEKHDTAIIDMTDWLASCDSLSIPIKWKDNYTVIRGELNKKNLSLEYISTDTMKLIKYTKGRWWWKKTYIDVFNSNPRNKVTSLTNIHISNTKRTPRISMGPYVGYGYNGSRWEPSIGIGVQFSLIRF